MKSRAQQITDFLSLRQNEYWARRLFLEGKRKYEFANDLIEDLLNRTACEEYNPLQLFVVEEIVEAPQAAWLAEGVGAQIRIVWINVTICKLNFIVNCCPQGNPQRLVLIHSDSRQIWVDRIHDDLNWWFLAELMTLKTEKYIMMLIKHNFQEGCDMHFERKQV